MKKFIGLSALCISLAVALFPLSGTEDADHRFTVNEDTLRDLPGLAKDEVPQDEIGDWKEALDSAVFTLFRRTELHRGRIRLLVLRYDSVLVDLSPDGTLLVSTGLLDCIDERIFLKAEGTSRRIRDFDAERERALVPFLAIQASRYALGTDSDSFEADRLATTILSVAGFKADLLSGWLSEMAAGEKSGTLSPALSTWLSAFPSPERRIAEMERESGSIQKTTSVFAGTLESLRTGTGLGETAASIVALRERGHKSLYLDRLEALVLHRLWLSGVPAEKQILKTFFPLADDLDPSSRDFLALAGNPAGIVSSTIPGDINAFLKAIEAYRNALEAIPEPGLVSSYARLLVHAGNAESRGHALSLARDAARAEADSTSRVARENYLAVLYLTESDPAKATGLALGAASYAPGSGDQDVGTRSASVNVPEGFPGDSRDFLLNRLIMGIPDSLSSPDRAAGTKGRASGPGVDTGRLPVSDLSFRKVRIGDSVDTVVAAWGKPAEINYTYYSERWDYPSLDASITVVKDSAGTHRVRLIRLGPASAVSPGHDIRTGDRRALFESTFGKPAWRSGDGYVYAVGEDGLKVIYLGDRIRSFTASGPDR